MTHDHDRADTGLAGVSGDPRRITDRHVHLLVALEVGVILLWAFWRLLGVELEVTAAGGTREVTLVAVVVTTTLAAVGSYALLWVWRHRELRVWTTVAGAVLLVSCTGPVFLATTLSAGISLLGFHLFVGIGLIEGVRHLDRAAR